MFRRGTLASLVAWITLAHGCADLPVVPAGTCGNGVVEAGEDCDSFASSPLTCGAPATSAPCRFTCAKKPGTAVPADCPSGFFCGTDDVCRAPHASFRAAGDPIAAPSFRLTAGDFDGDGRSDLLAFGAVDAVGRASARVLYFDGNAHLATSTDVPARVGGGAVGDVTGDGLSDLAFEFAPGASLVTGQRDRTLSPVAYPTIGLEASTGALIAVARAVPITQQTAYLATAIPGGGTTFSRVAEIGPPIPIVATDQSIDRLGDIAVGNLLDDAVTSPCDELAIAFSGDTRAFVLTTCAPDGNGGIQFADAAAPIVVDLVAETNDAGPLVADMNGDGHLDLILRTVDTTGAQTARVAYGNGAGVFFPKLDPTTKKPTGTPNSAGPLTLPRLGLQRYPLAVADLDGDNTPDFVMPSAIFASSLAAQAYPATWVVKENGYHLVDHARAGDWSEAKIADFDRDGILDVFAAVSTGLELDFLGGTGAGFNLAPIAVSGTVSHLAVGDFDGDLTRDLAFSVEGLHVEDMPQTAPGDTLTVIYGRAYAFPDPPVAIGQLARIQQVLAAHLASTTPSEPTGSVADIGVVSISEDQKQRSIAVLYGSTDRQPIAPFGLNDLADGFRGAAAAVVIGRFRNEAQPHFAVLGLDLDGSTDAATYRLWLVRVDSNAQIVSQTASQPLPAEAHTAKGKLGFGGVIAHADLDGDGVEELVWLAETGTDHRTGELFVARSVCDASDSCTFVVDPPRPLTTSSRVVTMRPADLDGDGHVDLFLERIGTPAGGKVTDAQNDLVVLWNTGGTIDTTNPTIVKLPAPLVGAETIRADTRPHPSIAALTPSGVYLVQLDASRAPTITALPGVAPPGSGCTVDHPDHCAITVGDVDGDGLRDIIVSDGDHLRVYRGE